MPQTRKTLAVLLAIFAFSGLAGLIYQSIWSHYLGLTLGHAAYAQTLVLAIFMGGMALGAWWVSRASLHWASSLRAYAWAELAIGIAGLVFHALFLAYTDFSQDRMLPALGGPAAHAYQWITATLLILPQCVVLGMTFPLMSSAALRWFAERDGEVLGGLYFSNSLGAAVGALLATFLLLPAIGMPGAMYVAGVLNLLVAAAAWWLSRGVDSAAGPRPAEAARAPAALPPGEKGFGRILLLAAAITGATSFVYEIVWVRLLNQALGTTLHSFELMLSAFILGLAMGGWWIRKRGAAIGDVLAYAGVAQVLMGVAALASAPVFTRSFAWVGWLTNNLPRTDDGYTLYNLGSAGIALAVMFPAAFFAGMTLPLFTMALLRRGHGEAAIGRVYAANTVGAILGVVAAVHLLVPLVGLHLSLVLAGMADLALGFYLLRFLAERSSGRQLAGLGVASVASVVLALLLGRPDPIAQVSGVFRTGKFFDPKTVQVVYLRDGKTSTVSLVFYPAVGTASIATNGKPDASLAVDLALPPAADEITMVMAGSLPLAAHPAPGEIGIIGWGSGLTTHTVLGSPRVRKVDNVEIEPAMVEGARFFGERVGRAYADPRSTILYDDARTYFATGGKAYDVIISEPSNPWVSGVANLFTEEFYGFLRRHLREEGVLVQWIQSYELDDALLARMVAALQKNFPHVDVYLTNHADLLFLASNEPLKPVDLSRIDSAALRDEAARVGLAGPADYQLRRIGDARLLAAMTRLMGAKGHSDFHPVVALQAPRSRFLGARADLLHLLVENGMPVLDTLGQRSLVPRAEPVSATEFSRYYNSRRRAIAVVDTLATGEADPWLPGKYAEVDGKLRQLRLLSGKPVQSEQLAEWSDAVAIAAANSIGFLPAADLQAAWIAPAWLAPGQPEAVSLAMAAYAAAARRDGPAMREAAVRLLSLEGSGLSSMLREQMLVIAMSGAAAQGDMAAVGEIESRFGPGIDRYTDYTKVRSFLLAWADK